MKSKLTNQTPAAVVLAVSITLIMMTALAARAANVANPAPGLPAAPAIDPGTGLPLPSPAAPWKDPSWKDPEKILAEVSWDSIPLGEVARYLRQEFKNAFDVLIPNGWRDPNNPGVSVDPQANGIRMQLKNVTASEVFNAMNLMFETENMPYRWELKLNGTRPTALLRVLPGLLPVVAPPPAPPEPRPPTRMIYFVGDLIGDEKSGGLTMERLVETVAEVYQMSYGRPKGSPSKSVLQFHKETQLLIVTGTTDQIEFVLQTLSALRQKVQLERALQPKAAEAKPKTEETKTR